MLQLHQFALSGHAHKVRLMLSLLGLAYDTVDVAGAERQHKSPGYLAMNPFGQVPVLVDGTVVLRDSQGILAYLALRHGAGTWWPDDPAAVGEIVAWFATSANEVARGPNQLRLHHRFGRDIDLDAAQSLTATLLQILEVHLWQREWLVGTRATAADVAMYPYLALLPEARVALAPWPALRGWLARVQELPGYVGMPGMWSPGTEEPS